MTGEPTEQINPPAPCPFKVGNKVKVDLEPEVLQRMQDGHGGWNPRMAEVSLSLCHISLSAMAAAAAVPGSCHTPAIVVQLLESVVELSYLL